jgi:hypothetical protein
VATDEPARLRDAESCSESCEIGLLKSRSLVPEPVDFGADEAAALDFGVGEVVRAGGIDVAGNAFGGAPWVKVAGRSEGLVIARSGA